MGKRLRMLPVTVVIPSYNRSSFLRSALESIALGDQQPQAVVVVDDGSSEDLGTVAASFGARIIRQRNQGPSAARNLGLAQTRTPWVAFLDDDDAWESGKLSAQWSALMKDPQADAVFGDYAVFEGDRMLSRSALCGENGPAVGNHIADVRSAYRTANAKDVGDGVVLCEGKDLVSAMSRYNFILTSSLLVRREAALAVGGFDPNLSIAEDWDFLLRLLHRNPRVIGLIKPIVKYQFHDGGASRDFLAAAVSVATMVQKIRHFPERYPAESIDFWRRTFTDYTTDAGMGALRHGEFHAARILLGHGLGDRPSVPVAVAFAGCFALDNGVARSTIRRLKAIRNSGRTFVTEKRQSA